MPLTQECTNIAFLYPRRSSAQDSPPKTANGSFDHRICRSPCSYSSKFSCISRGVQKTCRKSSYAISKLRSSSSFCVVETHRKVLRWNGVLFFDFGYVSFYCYHWNTELNSISNWIYRNWTSRNTSFGLNELFAVKLEYYVYRPIFSRFYVNFCSWKLRRFHNYVLPEKVLRKSTNELA